MARFAKVAAAGPLLAAELDALGKALGNPARPMAAIVAGSKVSTKLDVLNSLAGICDQLIVGGGIANTFLAAAGHKVGKSLYEADLVETAKAIAAKVKVPLPVDVVVAKEFAESAVATVKAIAEVADDDMILDIGPQTAAQFAELLKTSKTILWNGPVGVFEFDQFGEGTRTLANAIADSAAFSIAGGGDAWRRSTSTASPSGSPIFPPVAARSSSSSRARSCRPWKSWSSAPGLTQTGQTIRRPRGSHL